MAPAFSRPCRCDAGRCVGALVDRPGSSWDARWQGGWRPPPLFQRPRDEDTWPVDADLPRPLFVQKRRHLLPHQATMVIGPGRRICKVCLTMTKKCCSLCRDNDIKHYYCSRQCQQQDWPQHREICGVPIVLVFFLLTGPRGALVFFLRTGPRGALVLGLVVPSYQVAQATSGGM